MSFLSKTHPASVRHQEFKELRDDAQAAGDIKMFYVIERIVWLLDDLNDGHGVTANEASELESLIEAFDSGALDDAAISEERQYQALKEAAEGEVVKRLMDKLAKVDKLVEDTENRMQAEIDRHKREADGYKKQRDQASQTAASLGQMLEMERNKVRMKRHASGEPYDHIALNEDWTLRQRRR